MYSRFVLVQHMLGSLVLILIVYASLPEGLSCCKSDCGGGKTVPSARFPLVLQEAVDVGASSDKQPMQRDHLLFGEHVRRP